MFLLHNMKIFPRSFPQSQTLVANTNTKQKKARPQEDVFNASFDRKINLWLNKAVPAHFYISK